MIFDGLVAIVTGGASGIGAAIARQLHAAGAAVAVLDLQELGVGVPHLFVQTDVTNDESVRAAIDTVVDRLGGIDIVVNNAGVGAQGDITANDDVEWHRLWDVNVVGMVRVTRAALPHIRRSQAPAIVNMSSVAATTGIPSRALYSATKGAILAMTRAMAVDHLHEGIRVNAVTPSTADTPWIDALLRSAEDVEAERAALSARQPHGRLVRPDEIAAAVLFLASPDSGSTTGTAIAIDGGLETLRPRPSNS